MTFRLVTRVFFALVLFTFAAASWSSPIFNLFGSNKTKEFLPLEEAFKYSAWVEADQLTAVFTLAPEYYLYKDRLSLEIDPTAGLELGAINYPAALSQEDEFFGVMDVYYNEVILTAPLTGSKQQADLKLKLGFQGCADAGLCYPPETAYLNIALDKLQLADNSTKTSENSNKLETNQLANQLYQQPEVAAEPEASIPTSSISASDLSSEELAAPPASQLSQVLNSNNTGLVIGLFFLAGLGLTFTPCVLPMLPILSAIIIGKGTSQPSKKRGFALSTAYALGMALAYALIGMLMGWFGAGLNLQAAMQTPWLLIPAALIFVALALALFDVWHLQLPAAVTSKLDALQQPKSGTLFNVALMGALSTLVVSPCLTAPLAGALAFIATTGEASLGALALFMLGLGMGVPLIITGTFGAHWLPKAGQWLNQVKIFFGILLLATALWLIARLLPASLSLALWGLLALGVGVFMGGLNFSASSGWAKLRLSLGLALILYATSLLVGALAGNSNPLQPLHGVLNVGQSSTIQANAPAEVPVITDLEAVEGLIATSQEPILLDLSADWCVSCKVMDARVFPRAEVQEQLAGFRHVKYDLTSSSPAEKAWLKANQLFGPPTLMFFHQGKELTAWRIAGEANAQQLTQHLKALNQQLN